MSLSLDFCATCEHLDAITTRRRDDGGHGYLECSPPMLKESSPHVDAHMDIQEAAMRSCITEVMQKDIVCVRADASVEAIAGLLTDGLRCVPVVDVDDRPVGVVSKSNLLRNRLDADERVASEIMTPFVHALPETAPVVFAVALMASEGVLEVPIVDDEGTLVGMMTALDALRWLAQRCGYVFDRESRSKA